MGREQTQKKGTTSAQLRLHLPLILSGCGKGTPYKTQRWRNGGLNACKNKMQDAQHKQATQGGTNQAKPQAERTRNRTKNPKTRNANNNKTANTNKPLGLREKPKPNKKTPENTGGGGSHAVYSESMKRANSSEVIVKSSVVPKKQKAGKQKTHTKKQPANRSRRSQSSSKKKQVESQPCAPTPKRERERTSLGEDLAPKNNINTNRPISCRATWVRTASCVSGAYQTAQDSYEKPQKLSVQEGRRGPRDTPVTLEGRSRGERHREVPKDLPASPTAPKPQNPDKIQEVPETPTALVPSLGRLSLHRTYIIIGPTKSRQRPRTRNRKEAKTVPNKDRLPFPGTPTWRGGWAQAPL